MKRTTKQFIAISTVFLMSTPLMAEEKLDNATTGETMDEEVLAIDDKMEVDTDTRTTELDMASQDEYEAIDINNLTSEQLEGMRVYDSEGNEIGEIGNLVLIGDTLKQAVIDVGGFLGMGEHSVAVDISRLSFQGDSEDADDISVHTDMSKAQLKALPEYEPAS